MRTVRAPLPAGLKTAAGLLLSSFLAIANGVQAQAPAATAPSPPHALAEAPIVAPIAEPIAEPVGEALLEASEDSAATPTTTLAKPSGPDAHEKVVTKTPSILTSVGAPEKEQWEKEHGGFTASRFAIARRLRERPLRLLSNRTSLPVDKDEFLRRVAHDTWRGLQAYTDQPSGLVLDNVRIIGSNVAPLALRVGDYTNITNVGLQLAAIVAARRLGFLSEADAHSTALRIVKTLGALRKHDGYFFNYYDTTTLEATSSFLSFVDTGWLVAGLMISKQAFPDLEDPINALLEPIDFHSFYNEATGLMSHGYYVNLGSRSVYEYGTFYTEARLGSLIAIGKGDVPASHWSAMKRASRSPCGEDDCPDFHRVNIPGPDGIAQSLSYFRWRSYQYVPSWGGSMFEALMPQLVFDEGRWAPRSLGLNGQAHAEVQKFYAEKVLGLPVWGMSPCIAPDSGRYREFGIPVLGAHGYAQTVVSPHATALALAVTPEEATKGLMELARRYDIYGPFGFYDSVVPATGKVAYDQLALDQLMLFLAIANHLTNGEVTDRFTADPWIQSVLPMVAEQRFFPAP